MESLPGYDAWKTTPPEDQCDTPLCPTCETELFADNTCRCGGYCVDCCPDCNPPKSVHNALMSAFHGRESDKYEGFYPVWDDDANNWLVKHIGIFTYDEAIYTKLNDAFTVVYDWHIQRFCVGTGEPE